MRDAELQGFALRATQGRKSFILGKRSRGRMRRLTIGHYGCPPAGSAAFDGALFYKYTLNTFPEPPRMSIGSWRRIMTWADRGNVDGQGARVTSRSATDRARRHARREDPALKSCGRGSLAAISSVGVSKLFAGNCAPLIAWTGEVSQRDCGKLSKICS